MKKIIALLLTALAMLISWSALAADTNLRTAADKLVPDGAVLLRQEKEDGMTEYTYWIAQTQEIYEVTLNSATGAIVKIESDLQQDDGSRNVALTEEDIVQQIQVLFPGSEVNWVMLDEDDNLPVYRVQFTTDAYAGQVKLHPESGKVLEMELNYTQTESTAPKGTTGASVTPRTTQAPAASSSSLIGTKRAREIALEKAGGGRVIHIELDKEDGRQVYEGEVIHGDYEYDFEIDAETGRILDWDRERLDD